MKITRRVLLILLFVAILFIPVLSAEDYTRWQLPEGAKLRLGKGSLYDIKFTPDGNRIAVATSIGIWIYDAHTGEELALLVGHTDIVTSLGFPADGRFLASGSLDGTVRLWELPSGHVLTNLIGHGDIDALRFSDDGKTLASSDGQIILLWDLDKILQGEK